MPSTYQHYFSLLSFLGISVTWPPLLDWISSAVRRDDTRFTLSRRRVFQTQHQYSYTPSQLSRLFTYLLAGRFRAGYTEWGESASTKP
jgi:hypothetical protein